MKRQILVYYIPVGNLDQDKVKAYIEEACKEIGVSKEDCRALGIVHQIFFPIRHDGARVESIHVGD